MLSKDIETYLLRQVKLAAWNDSKYNEYGQREYGHPISVLRTVIEKFESEGWRA